jgi:hypothetical protein
MALNGNLKSIKHAKRLINIFQQILYVENDFKRLKQLNLFRTLKKDSLNIKHQFYFKYI